MDRLERCYQLGREDMRGHHYASDIDSSVSCVSTGGICLMPDGWTSATLYLNFRLEGSMIARRRRTSSVAVPGISKRSLRSYLFSWSLYSTSIIAFRTEEESRKGKKVNSSASGK